MPVHFLATLLTIPDQAKRIPLLAFQLTCRAEVEHRVEHGVDTVGDTVGVLRPQTNEAFTLALGELVLSSLDVDVLVLVFAFSKDARLFLVPALLRCLRPQRCSRQSTRVPTQAYVAVEPKGLTTRLLFLRTEHGHRNVTQLVDTNEGDLLRCEVAFDSRQVLREHPGLQRQRVVDVVFVLRIRIHVGIRVAEHNALQLVIRCLDVDATAVLLGHALHRKLVVLGLVRLVVLVHQVPLVLQHLLVGQATQDRCEPVEEGHTHRVRAIPHTGRHFPLARNLVLLAEELFLRQLHTRGFQDRRDVGNRVACAAFEVTQRDDRNLLLDGRRHDQQGTCGLCRLLRTKVGVHGRTNAAAFN